MQQAHRWWSPTGHEYRPDFDYSEYLGAHEGFYFRDRQHEQEVVENLVWEARFRYYVLSNPLLTDDQYDRLERRLTAISGRRPRAGSPLLVVGSSNWEVYPPNIRALFRVGASKRKRTR